MMMTRFFDDFLTFIRSARYSNIKLVKSILEKNLFIHSRLELIKGKSHIFCMGYGEKGKTKDYSFES